MRGNRRKVLLKKVPKGDRQAATGENCAVGHEAKGLPEATGSSKETHTFCKLHPESPVWEKRRSSNIKTAQSAEFFKKPPPFFFLQNGRSHLLPPSLGDEPLKDDARKPEIPGKAPYFWNLPKVPPVKRHHKDHPEGAFHKVDQSLKYSMKHTPPPDSIVDLFHPFKGDFDGGELGKRGKLCHRSPVDEEGVGDEHDLQNPGMAVEKGKKAKELPTKEERLPTGEVENSLAVELFKPLKEPPSKKGELWRFFVLESFLVTMAAPEVAAICEVPLEIERDLTLQRASRSVAEYLNLQVVSCGEHFLQSVTETLKRILRGNEVLD
jgi:hypothetical protein